MTVASKWPVCTPPLTLGVMYDKGESVPQDYVQAHRAMPMPITSSVSCIATGEACPRITP